MLYAPGRSYGEPEMLDMHRVSDQRSVRPSRDVHETRAQASFVCWKLIMSRRRSINNGQLKDTAHLCDAAVGVEPGGLIVLGESFLSVALAVVQGDPVIMAVVCILDIKRIDGQANQRTSDNHGVVNYS